MGDAGIGLEVEIGVCGLAVHFVAQTADRSSVNIYVQEGDVAFTFSFRGELMYRWILFRWCRKSSSLSGPCGPMKKVSST
jgi:hypothetical protein